MESTFRKILTPFVLASFLMVVFFGFNAMSRGIDGSMQVDCPFSATGASLCPQSAAPGVLHHLSAYQSFLNVPVHSGIPALVLALCISIFFVLFANPFLLIPIAPLKVLHKPLLRTLYDKKLIHWLSLLENSPSFR